ncbi:MAG: CoA pyrophosphatase [Flavobacterium sp.]|jgi:8-oxo-dGTP pyrophosphatase MutT (NUDIX family)|nr:CoA pyrophosphatase [Flavobacterium sp.]MBT6377993.1 CoA pyrophosphatase [Flavobacterium sp.]MBT6881483.1 CoA pyrophosphatase [Flavobacterium sp.]
MKFEDFTKNITQLKKIQLGGVEAQFKLAPEMRLAYDDKKITANNPKIAAVLALFYPNNNNNTSLLLTKRASYNGPHSNQISFPGGKIEKSDNNLSQTALRETFEEVGVSQEKVEILREITNVYIPPSNFLVTPFIGITKTKPMFKVNSEVAEIIEISFLDLLDDNNVGTIQITNSYMKETLVPSFNINGSVIWGATAMILSEIKEVLKKTQL